MNETLLALIKNSPSLAQTPEEQAYWINATATLTPDQASRLTEILTAEQTKSQAIQASVQAAQLAHQAAYLKELETFKHTTLHKVMERVEVKSRESENPDQLLAQLDNV